MQIEKYLNTTFSEITKIDNVVIEANLGTKFFLDETVIKEYLAWSLENFNHVLIVIPDELQAINYRVKDGYREKQAIDVAMRKGREMDNRIEKVIKDFFLKQKNRLTTLHWADVKTVDYSNKRNILNQNFKSDPNFNTQIIRCVTEQTSTLKRAFKPVDYEGLAVYLLSELPLLLTGVEWKNVHYTIFIRPGLSEAEHLSVELQKGNAFPKITKALGLKTKTSFIEVKM